MIPSAHPPWPLPTFPRRRRLLRSVRRLTRLTVFRVQPVALGPILRLAHLLPLVRLHWTVRPGSLMRASPNTPSTSANCPVDTQMTL
ncbi:hypothetical protein BDW68DRAFT_151663 [Aspergillus falconensis]